VGAVLGYPVQLAKLPDEGVPSAGVTSVGDCQMPLTIVGADEPTKLPVPVEPDKPKFSALLVATLIP
jgi:hypothetical protein